jgi:hypothetical protein
MDVALVRKMPFLLLRDGRYHARRVVSQELRSIAGKNELREPLDLTGAGDRAPAR